MSSLTSDQTAIITKQNIHGTSYDQFLSLSYHVSGIGSKITVSLHGGNTGVLQLWSSDVEDLSQHNEWKSATANITTLENYEVFGGKFVIFSINRHACIKKLLVNYQCKSYWFNQFFNIVILFK